MKNRSQIARKKQRSMWSFILALGSAAALLVGCGGGAGNGGGLLGPVDGADSGSSDAVADAGGGTSGTGDGTAAGGGGTSDVDGGTSGAGGVAAGTGGTEGVPPQTEVPVDGDAPGPIDPGVALPTPSGDNPPLEGTYLDLETFPYGGITSGGPPKDGIPALTNPPFVGPSRVTYLQDDDLVLGVVVNGEAKAYPNNIGWWHEIVNDRIGGKPIAVTFCPLTGTGLVFDAQDDNGRQFELGVSGLLFNSNLIMYDRRDGNTLYPQIAHKAVEGSRQGETLTLLPVVETTWDTWKKLHPDTRVVETGTYSLSLYREYPYGDYRTNDRAFLFGLDVPLSLNENPYAQEFRAKERVLGVRLDGEAKAYPFSSMDARSVINDRVGGVDIAVLWDRQSTLAIPYAREVNGRTLTFDIDMDVGFPFGMKDQETGTVWNANGLAVEGELAGVQLAQVPAHNSMWFAWVTFWQNTDVWQ